MNKLYFVIFVALCTGCTSGFSGWTEQSLLLQENQRLEQALYITHAQLQDVKRENAVLRGEPANEPAVGMPAHIIKPPRRAKSAAQDADEAPAFEAPKVEIPADTPESTSPPDSLKNSMVLPEFPATDEALVPPAWSPVR